MGFQVWDAVEHALPSLGGPPVGNFQLHGAATVVVVDLGGEGEVKAGGGQGFIADVPPNAPPKRGMQSRQTGRGRALVGTAPAADPLI